MYGWCLQVSSVLSLDLSFPRRLVMWPGSESGGDATCCCGQIGWWPVVFWLELWSSFAYVWHCWLVSVRKHHFNISRIKHESKNQHFPHLLAPFPWIWVAWEAADQSALPLAAVGLPHGRLLIQRLHGDLAEEAPQEPAGSNVCRLHSTR